MFLLIVFVPFPAFLLQSFTSLIVITAHSCCLSVITVLSATCSSALALYLPAVYLDKQWIFAIFWDDSRILVFFVSWQNWTGNLIYCAFAQCADAFVSRWVNMIFYSFLDLIVQITDQSLHTGPRSTESSLLFHMYSKHWIVQPNLLPYFPVCSCTLLNRI